MKFELSETLKSRTFVGLLLAQFTATFNDQAIHMVAVFYAVDMLVRYANASWIDDKGVVSLVTACFITPFLLFSSFAGSLGDRFSKRSVIVFWKVAEVGMMALALLGLSLTHFVPPDSPSLPTLAVWSASLVVATVFLMGLHSTFFVPAKLGAMPEILHPSILSRGNGLLEGTSFTAQILGTSCGGILYSLLKGEIVDGTLHPGREWVIGVLLLVLAILGTATAVLMHPIPAAAPDRKVSWNWWRPLKENLTILWRSKPLTLSVTGIAFCVFMTLFLRQTLLYQGELKKEYESARTSLAVAQGESFERKPTGIDRLLMKMLPPRLEKAAQESELRVALLFALVGLGVGVGSVAAGYLSGHRVELGLVPIGALGIIGCTLVSAIPGKPPAVFVACLFGIGFCAGFYLVPLYTLLQQRAPKESKGNVVAASNFLNVLGGIISVFAFYAFTFSLDKLLGASISEHQALHDPALLLPYVRELKKQLIIPNLLFVATSVLTGLALVFLVRKLPDFFVRTAIWLRAKGHNPLRTTGIDHMPLDGPVVLLTNCDTFPAALNLIAGVDRYPHVILVEAAGSQRGESHLRRVAQRAGTVLSLRGDSPKAEWDRALETGLETLRKGEMVALTVNGPAPEAETGRLVARWREFPGTRVVPVFCYLPDAATLAGHASPPRVIFGEALADSVDIAEARRLIADLANVSEHEV